MSGALVAASLPTSFRVSIADTGVADGGIGGGAAYKLESDGDVITTTTASGAIDAGDWITPKTASALGIFSVRATLNSGSLLSGTVDSLLALTSDREWTVGAAGAANLTIEISKDDGATVFDSATVTLTGS